MDENLKNFEIITYAHAALMEARKLNSHPWRTTHIRHQLRRAIESLQRFVNRCQKDPELAAAAGDFLTTLKTEIAILKKENAPARASYKRTKGDFTYGR